MEKRTIDFVAPGEQQPEVDHAMQSERSKKGNANNNAFREAVEGGFFSYSLATNKKNNLNLMVRYWGGEKGVRSFDIDIDDQVLVSENIVNKWNTATMVEVEYRIPVAMLANNEFIRVKFQAKEMQSVGPVYFIRLVQPKD